MKEKRNLLKVLKMCRRIVLAVFVFIISYIILYNNFIIDDVQIQNAYETKKEKIQLLKSIPADFIEEGKGINIQELPYQDIQYKIYNDNENIIFYYYVKEENSGEKKFKATITLSNDYEILDEEYSVDQIEDFETYKRRDKIFGRLFIFVGSSFITIGLVLIKSAYTRKKK